LEEVSRTNSVVRGTPDAEALTSFRVPDWASQNDLKIAYKTGLGVSVVGKSEQVLGSAAGAPLQGKVQLVFTSPPFPLNRKKRYGNLEGEQFREWLVGYAKLLRSLLTEDGAIVMEMGNAWEPGLPVMSTLAMETLLDFKRAADLYLCQEFVWFNPARLPTPAAWVTVNRLRVKDAFTRVWWLSPTPYPKADNRRVLQPYSGSMKSLLERGSYNAGKRPSQHRIGETSFLKDHGGAIPPNVLELDPPPLNNVLVEGNTNSFSDYRAYCKEAGIDPHPATMPVSLARFFVSMCTEQGDVVLDPFAGSNTTGVAAEQLGRQWVSIEASEPYADSGIGHFPQLRPASEARGTSLPIEDSGA
jgi:site-specific DNA-methyltransferase (cytosine-N4-specific)